MKFSASIINKNPDADISKMTAPEPPPVAKVPELIGEPESKYESTSQYGTLTIPPPSAYLID